MPCPSLLQERMPGCAKVLPLRTAMRRLPHAGALDASYARAGVGITGAAGWRPRCTVSNDWARGSCHVRSSGRSMSCISEPPFSTGSKSWAVRRRWLWHSHVWGQGKSAPTLIYATAPLVNELAIPFFGLTWRAEITPASGTVDDDSSTRCVDRTSAQKGAHNRQDS